MVASESPSELEPLNKSAVSGEIKPTLVYAHNGAEPPEKGASVPESDRVQFSREPEETQAHAPYARTANPYLNEYIDILSKSEAEGLLPNGERARHVAGSKEGVHEGVVKKKEGFDLFA